MLMKLYAMVFMSISWLKTGFSVGCCKNYKNPAGSVRGEEVLVQLKQIASQE